MLISIDNCAADCDVPGPTQGLCGVDLVLLLSMAMGSQQKAPSVELNENMPENDQQAPKAVDTKHQDEALRVLDTYDGDTQWTDAEEGKLRRKLDWKLMPVLCMTYGMQYYDKAMLSQAV
jgi:hypothetical protein